MSGRLPEDKEQLFWKVFKETYNGPRYKDNKKYMMHGTTSVMDHCVNVAYTAYYRSYKLGFEVKEAELIRGALLHDYFLYDWHEKSWANSIHGYTHPGKALKNAKMDYYLSATERDMIKHHMFPLTPRFPRSREGKILCAADKLCAMKETVYGRIKK